MGSVHIHQERMPSRVDSLPFPPWPPGSFESPIPKITSSAHTLYQEFAFGKITSPCLISVDYVHRYPVKVPSGAESRHFPPHAATKSAPPPSPMLFMPPKQVSPSLSVQPEPSSSLVSLGPTLMGRIVGYRSSSSLKLMAHEVRPVHYLYRKDL